MKGFFITISLACILASSALAQAQDGAIDGTVYDDGTGLPLEGVVARIPYSSIIDTTDESGYYILPNLAAGNYRVSYQKQGYYSDDVYNVWVGDGDTVTVDFTLIRWVICVLTGNVTDENAVPLDSVHVTGGAFSTFTDVNGDYFLDIPSYGLNFTFSKPTYYDTTLWIDVFGADTVVVDMTMRTILPGVQGKVINMLPAVVESVLVSVIGTSFQSYTDDHGDFVVEGLDPGIYDISFSHPVYLDTIITDILADSGSQDYYQVILASKSAVTGQVFNLQDSLPLSDVNIRTYYDSNIEGLSDSTGYFIVRPVPGRSYQLVFEKRNYFEQNFPGIVVGVAETLMLGDIYMEPYPGDVKIWYGNPDGSPVTVPINSTIFMAVYCQTADTVDLGFLHLPLGTDDRYIVDYLSEALGVLYYPLTEWDYADFYPPNDFEPGWHSQSLLGFYWLTGSPGPPLHYEVPTMIAKYAFKTANDSSLIGDTVYCFTEGFDDANGGPAAGGLDGITPYYPVQYFSPLYFSDNFGNCIYTVGDVNGSWSYDGLDIIYGVASFKGGPLPPYECECTAGNSWYVAGDVNASCSYNGLDITYGVSYFKGGPAPLSCPACPPSQ